MCSQALCLTDHCLLFLDISLLSSFPSFAHCRALVFFYDGFAQYLPPSRLHLCYQWDSITPDRNYRSIKKFFKEYFSQYPKRLMLRLREGDTVQLERFRDVLEARVVQVDCSLVKVWR